MGKPRKVTFIAGFGCGVVAMVLVYVWTELLRIRRELASDFDMDHAVNVLYTLDQYGNVVELEQIPNKHEVDLEFKRIQKRWKKVQKDALNAKRRREAHLRAPR